MLAAISGLEKATTVTAHFIPRHGPDRCCQIACFGCPRAIPKNYKRQHKFSAAVRCPTLSSPSHLRWATGHQDLRPHPRHTERRVRRWLTRRTGHKDSGIRQFPTKYLYETLGLYAIPRRRADLPRAKV